MFSIFLGWLKVSGICIGIGWHQSLGIGIGWNFGIFNVELAFLVRLKEHLRSHDFQDQDQEDQEEDFFEPAAIEVYDSSNESSLHAE